jgi:endogenous inhibitor of DNA gyrase (YacG/DUF329 family)
VVLDYGTSTFLPVCSPRLWNVDVWPCTLTFLPVCSPRPQNVDVQPVCNPRLQDVNMQGHTLTFQPAYGPRPKDVAVWPCMLTPEAVYSLLSQDIDSWPIFNIERLSWAWKTRWDKQRRQIDSRQRWGRQRWDRELEERSAQGGEKQKTHYETHFLGIHPQYCHYHLLSSKVGGVSEEVR